jgi:hypothetical protein
MIIYNINIYKILFFQMIIYNINIINNHILMLFLLYINISPPPLQTNLKIIMRRFIRSFSSKIYTRTGDNGTSFINTETGRLPKYSLIFQILGDTDELSSSIGYKTFVFIAHF